MGQSKHGFGTLIDPFRWLVAFFPTPMHVRRPQEAKKTIKKFDPKIPKPPPTRPLCPALSLKDVTVICLSLFTDGLSTTTPTILFNLYCLATWPEVQQRVYNEIAEQVKKQSGHFSENGLSGG